MLVDTLGTGMWLPIGLIFFTRAQHLPLAQVGPALTVGGLVGLVVGPLSGTLVDRWGPARFVLLSTALRVPVFALYPWVGSAWQVAVLAALFSACDRLFWTANTPMVAQFADGAGIDRMMGTQNVIRIVGLGVGAGLSGLLAGSVSGLHGLAYLNALSYAVAAVIVVASVSLAAHGVPNEEAAGWRDVLADRPYVVFCGVQLLYALCALSLVVILPVVALSPFGGPTWLPGVSILAGSVALALAQRPAVHLAARTSRLHGLVLASVTMAVTFALLAAGTHVSRSAVVPLVLGTSVLGVVGEALAVTSMISAASASAPAALEGRYSALFQTAWGFATVLAPALFTSLLVAGNGTLWLTLAALALAAIPVLLAVRPKLPSTALGRPAGDTRRGTA